MEHEPRFSNHLKRLSCLMNWLHWKWKLMKQFKIRGSCPMNGNRRLCTALKSWGRRGFVKIQYISLWSDSDVISRTWGEGGSKSTRFWRTYFTDGPLGFFWTKFRNIYQLRIGGFSSFGPNSLSFLSNYLSFFLKTLSFPQKLSNFMSLGTISIL